MIIYKELKKGDKIKSLIDGEVMEVMFYDFYGDGKILCFATEKSIYPADEFSPSDWEKI